MTILKEKNRIGYDQRKNGAPVVMIIPTIVVSIFQEHRGAFP